MITLRKQLIVVYSLFICILLGVLTITLHYNTQKIFRALVETNIEKRSGEIVRAVNDLYKPFAQEFDVVTLQALGMYFTHEGYIVTVTDNEGELVWDARSCDMAECNAVINEITERMTNMRHTESVLQKKEFALTFVMQPIGNIIIETFGPYFYSDTEVVFISSVNKLLLASGVAFLVISIFISIVLSLSISMPVLKARDAALKIASGDLKTHINESYKTKELFELAHSINELSFQLAESERQKAQLLQDVAHELRTPLTCLQGNLEAILDGVWAATPQRISDCHEEVIRLAKLTEDINTLTNIEWHSIELHKSEFDIASLLGAMIGGFEKAAGEKQISLIAELQSVNVFADYDRLKQVFYNIVANAIKYTDAGSITVTSASKKEHVQITIADTGIGISAAELPHIFERFYRTDKSRSRKTGGSGIGLSIALAIVKAHLGEIITESGEGGSKFTVVLPRNIPAD
jgi:signal transduction histidine kinase